MKQNLKLFALCSALFLASNSADAANVYDNNISALNINMLTDIFMYYNDYSKRMSGLFIKPSKVYGTMDRVNEYGDDGSTVKTPDSNSSAKTHRPFFHSVWANVNHINEEMHYGQNITQHNRFNLATVGTTTRATRFGYGKVFFGGFASYINSQTPDFNSNGDTIGLFANYQNHYVGFRALADIGSLNNNVDGTKFNNSWVNTGLNVFGKLKLDDTLFLRPVVYATYTYVSSDDMYINNDRVVSDNFHFFNVSPSLTFIKEIWEDWYGSLSAKYVAHFGSKNDIEVNGVSHEGLWLENHTDIGIDVEHDYEQWTFGGKIHKQLGGIDGWSANVNVKYAF